MEKTANYHLNQWDAADPIRREDFNADNAKIDAALAAGAQALADYQTANDAAVAQKAEQSALEDVQTALQGDIAAAELRVTALEQGVALVRLGVVTTQAANQTVTIDLQDTDMSEYAALLVFVGAPLVNSTAGKLYLTVNGENLLLLKVYDTDAGSMLAWLQNAGGTIVGGALNASSGGSSIDSNGGSLSAQWTEMQSVGVKGTSAVGLTCAFYGFKG
ncbi:MAG: hypothetical protein ACI3XJ_07445 [Oscillospiraceae bacterium]